MKRFYKSALGVTLLEVMLVLAIAAMIIVMSVRYYQSATSSQQANSVMEQISSIVAAADNLAQSTGTYTASVINTSGIKALVPGNGLTTPWGSAITVTGANGSNQYNISVAAVPPAICPLIASKLKANTHFDPGSCTAGSNTDMSITYTSNP